MNHHHHTHQHIFLKRYIDKQVFGKWMAVTERRIIKRYRIKNGEVQIMFRDKWQDVVEADERSTDRIRRGFRDHANRNHHDSAMSVPAFVELN